MKKLFACLLAICMIGLGSTSAFAQVKIVRGEGSVTVQQVWASGPNENERSAALQEAKLSAWRAYMGLPGQNETVDQIRANENQFLQRLDDILVDVVTVNESYNKDSKRYTIRIKATVAETQIGSMLRAMAKGSGVSNDASAQAGRGVPGGLIMVLGMSREADVVKSFQAKQTDVAEVAAITESIKSKNASSTNVRVSETTGGSTERKRDKISYRVGNLGILNTKLPRILLQNGIKSTPYAFLMSACKLPSPDNFSKQYAASEVGELPSKVMGDIQQKLGSCGKVKYWVFASMDVGGYGTDPNTGMALATVSVSVQLFEVETGAQLASASKDLPGRAADQSDAIRVATDAAVQAVGDIITAQVASLR